MTSHAIDTETVAPRRCSAAYGGAVRLVHSVRRLLWFHRSRRALDGLPDDLLKDIGVPRCEIDFVADASAGSRSLLDD